MLCAMRGGEGGGWQRWCHRGGGGVVLYDTVSPQTLKPHSKFKNKQTIKKEKMNNNNNNNNNKREL